LRHKAGVAYCNHHTSFHYRGDAVDLSHAALSALAIRYIGAGRGQRLAPAQFKNMQMIVRVEMPPMPPAPFFATWMAQTSKGSEASF
jgi:hypothetical protein